MGHAFCLYSGATWENAGIVTDKMLAAKTEKANSLKCIPYLLYMSVPSPVWQIANDRAKRKKQTNKAEKRILG
jgi:hypothetical protein